MKKIKELLSDAMELGSKVPTQGIIMDLSKRKTKTNKTFLSGVLADSGARVPFNLWDGAEKAFESGFISGALIKANVVVSVYQGKRQITIDTFALMKEEEVNEMYTSLVPSSPFGLEALLGKLKTLTDMAHESDERYPDYDGFVEMMKEEGLYEKYISSPASVSVHQGYRRGLLEHSLFVAKGALDLGKPYQLSEALLIYGGLLHDLGKTDQYLYTESVGENNTGIAYDHSLTGVLAGHLVHGALLIREKLSKHLPGDIAAKLMHVSLSHHNSKEWGSPVGPAFAEAYVIHLADLANSHVPIYKEALNAPAGNVVGVRQYMLDSSFALTSEGTAVLDDLGTEEEEEEGGEGDAKT